MKKFSYKQAGVDIHKGDAFVKALKIKTQGKEKAFGTLFSLLPHLRGCKKPALVSSTDGVGTKLKIAQKLNIHDTVGIDLVAMNVNDIICQGAQPLFFLDYIACGTLKPKVLANVVKGIQKGLKQSSCPLIGGETAEMPGMYDADEYDLAGFCVGIVDEDRVITGQNIKPSDVVIGLSSSGIHSNGFSLVRAVLGKKGIKQHGKTLLTPTKIYVKPVLSAIKKFNKSKQIIKGIAHVTGGAFYSKVTKILPKGCGMVLQKKAWPVPKIFTTIQKQGNVEEKEMYSVFNMGIGMILVVDKKYATKVYQELKKMDQAYIIGEVIKSSTKMQMQ